MDSPETWMTQQLAGDESVPCEPGAPELDASDDALVVDDGAVAGSRGDLAYADIVAIVDGRGARGRVPDAPGRR